MSLIYLIEHPEDFRAGGIENCLCVVHKHFRSPGELPENFITFEEFFERPRDYVSGTDHLILIGLSRMMTPSNRTKMVWEVIFNNTPNLHKIVVDQVLFVGEPWRAWFPFGAVGAKYDEYTYSYIAESHYSAWLNGLREDDPFCLEEITKWSQSVVRSTYKEYFLDLRVREIALPAKAHAAYADLKEQCFNEETTLNGIVSRLAKFAQSECPGRKMLTGVALWSKRELRLTITDLAVDKFLLEKTRSLVGLTNGILGACYDDDGCIQDT